MPACDQRAPGFLKLLSMNVGMRVYVHACVYMCVRVCVSTPKGINDQWQKTMCDWLDKFYSFFKPGVHGQRPRTPGFLKLLWFAYWYLCVCVSTHEGINNHGVI